MNNIINIFVREYVERVRTKAFLIITILAPVFFIAMFVGPAYFMARTSKVQRLAIVDLDGRIAPIVEERLTEKEAPPDPQEQMKKAATKGARNNPYLEDKYHVERIAVAAGQETMVRAGLSDRIKRSDLDAYLWLDKDIVASGQGTYYARNLADIGGVETARNAVSAAVTQLRLADKGVSADQVGAILKKVELRTLKVTEKGEKEDKSITGFLIPFFFTMLLYMTLLLYGVMVMRSVLEEKTSRVFEVLLSSVKPIELMAGKIIGVAAVGLTQFAAWGLMFGVAGGTLAAAAATWELDLSIPTSLLVYFVIYFIFGYLMFSAMYAAVGASSNSDQEAQQLQMAILPFIIVPMASMQMVIRNPSGPVAVGMSLFPLFSPILMFLRICTEPPPVWQIALSFVLLAATTAGLVWMCARIYRVGILMYGKRATLPELIRWIRA
jgi:ABC-2 type transport system permease protein